MWYSITTEGGKISLIVCKTPSKRTGCNAKINSSAADRPGAFTRGMRLLEG